MANNTSSKNLDRPPITKWHIIWSSLLLTFAFTYAGVDESLWESFTDLAFNFNFLINFVQIYFLIWLSYYLHFVKKVSVLSALLIVFGTFLFLQLLQVWIIDYEEDDFTELYSITLPFGSVCLLAFNLYYHLLKKVGKNKTTEIEKINPLWLDTISGRVKIDENEMLYAFLTETYLEINLEESVHKTFQSLKQLEDLLADRSRFFRLNKKYLSRRDAILSYKSLSDGRLEITLPNDKKCIVSKNKASSFKKWLDEA